MPVLGFSRAAEWTTRRLTLVLHLCNTSRWPLSPRQPWLTLRVRRAAAGDCPPRRHLCCGDSAPDVSPMHRSHVGCHASHSTRPRICRKRVSVKGLSACRRMKCGMCRMRRLPGLRSPTRQGLTSTAGMEVEDLLDRDLAPTQLLRVSGPRIGESPCDPRAGPRPCCYHAATRTPRTRTIQEDMQLIWIALLC